MMATPASVPEVTVSASPWPEYATAVNGAFTLGKSQTETLPILLLGRMICWYLLESVMLARTSRRRLRTFRPALCSIALAPKR